ncbi:MAG: hypothetical protein PHP92_05500 [Candidatus Nanoarchaeia archaeon]|nr:hypothetical protein [Candidatus Nanoarchaeia archaeon]
MGNTLVGQGANEVEPIIDLFISQNDIVEKLPVDPVTDEDLSVVYKRRKSLGEADFRALYGTYKESNAEYEKISTTLKPFGSALEIDSVLAIAKQYEDESDAKAKAASLKLQKYFITGDKTLDQFDGLNRFCIANGQVATVGSGNGLACLKDATNARAGINALEDALDEIRGVDMNLRWLWSKKFQTMVGQMASVLPNVWYNPGDIAKGIGPSFAGVEIWTVTRDNLDAYILNWNETVGSATDCQSAYLIHIGSNDGVCWLTRKLEGQSGSEGQPLSYYKMGDLVGVEHGEQLKAMFQILIGLAFKTPYCAYKISGFRKSAVDA